MHTGLRPSELSPLRNFLIPDSQHPGHEEFTDLVEALCFASYPLAFDKPIDPDDPPGIASPYRELGIRILREAVRLAQFARSGKSEARPDAPWALTTAVFSVVPLAPDQGPRVLECISTFDPEDRWRTSHDLFEELLLHLSRCVKQAKGENTPPTFTLMRPNDPHELVVRSTDLLLDFLNAPVQRVVPTVPALLSVVTLGLHQNVYLFWLRSDRGLTEGMVEVWPFLKRNMSTVSKALRRQGIRLGPPVSRARCPAYGVYAQSLVFLRELTRRKRRAWAGYLIHEMLERLIYFLRELMSEVRQEGRSCRNCETALLDDRFPDAAERLIKVPTRKRTELLIAVSRHHNWLQAACLREIEAKLRLDADIRIVRPVSGEHRRLASPPAPKTALHAYSFPSPHGEFWAKFLPGLGQVWVMPDCPDRFLGLVEAHEIQHYCLSAFQVSQLLPLKHALLDRLMPAPDRFNDIIKASYVLGLRLASGFPPDPARFPPTLKKDLELAADIAEVANALADKADPSVHKECAAGEAVKALLLLLQHVLPEGAGVGPTVLQWIRRITLPEPWRDTWHLWAMLQLELAMCLKQSTETVPFPLTLPADPHRYVPEMLVFLSHALQPIAERKEAVLMTFPGCLNVLMLGSLSCIPIIRVTEQKGVFAAEMSVVDSQPVREETVRRALQGQPKVVGSFPKEGVRCTCTDYFVRLLTDTTMYRTPTQPDRLMSSLSYVLANLELKQFHAEEQSCPICRYHLAPAVVQEAVEIVEDTLEGGKTDLLRAGQNYESWLLSDCLKLFRTTCKLHKRLQPIKRYNYL